MSKITEQIETMAQPIIDELELELVDVEFLKEGKNWFLRVFMYSNFGHLLTPG